MFLKLTTDNGIAGYGEVYGVPFNPLRVTGLIEDIFERHVAGWDPFRIERLWRTVYASGYNQHPDFTVIGVLSGIEIACWDIIGKALDQPIYNLLGGMVHERLRSYTYLYPEPVTGGPPPGRATQVQMDPVAAPQRAAAYAEQGFTAVKLDPVPPHVGARPAPAYPARVGQHGAGGAQRARGGRPPLRPADRHSRQMSAAAAIRLAKRLEQFDPLWFEEPVPPENRAEMAVVARGTSIPGGHRRAAGDQVRVRRLAQPAGGGDPAAGGWRASAASWRRRRSPAWPRRITCTLPRTCTPGPIEAAANIQLATCTPNFLIQESIETFGGFYAELLKQPLQWQDGYIIPPAGPGLGVELNEEVAVRHAYTAAEVFPRTAD